jgi:hypothetical protein
MGWDGMGWDGMGWDGMGWDGMGWNERRRKKEGLKEGGAFVRKTWVSNEGRKEERDNTKERKTGKDGKRTHGRLERRDGRKDGRTGGRKEGRTDERKA